MTTEQLYIDDNLVDISPNSSILIDIKSNLLRDIEDIVSNHTYTISLPKTANNMRILGNIDVVQDNCRNQYSSLPCRYLRNGIVIIDNGIVNILSVEEGKIQICITWGVKNILSLIKSEEKLTDLESDASLVWSTKNTKFTDYQEARNKGYFFAEYDPMIIQAEDTSWQYDNSVGGEQKRIDLELTDGLINISGTIGDIIDITPDINYHSVLNVVSSVHGGDAVYLTQVYPATGVYLYGYLDASMKLIQVSRKATTSTLTNINTIAPSKAAYFVANVDVASKDICEVYRIVDKNNEYTDGTNKPIVNMQHPVVSLSWVLARIREKYGVSLDFQDREGMLFRTKIAIPLIRKTGLEDQKQGICKAEFTATKIGALGMNIRSTTGIIPSSPATIKSLTFAFSCKATVDIQASYTHPAPKRYNGTNNHGGGGFMAAIFPNYIKMVITNTNKETTEYITIEDADQQITITSADVINDKITLKIRGWGSFDFTRGDSISLELCNSQGNLAEQDLNGTITITAAISDEVIVGNDYPIAQNLPDIKILDFLKTIFVLSGTYPTISTENSILLVRYNRIWENLAKAKDWTTKLIPTNINTPKKTEYVVSSWARINSYKWKQDEKTIYNYDGVLAIDNSTLDDARTVIELPFAASDGDRVPIYARTTSDAKFGNNAIKTNTGLAYKGCEPRIMFYSANASGKAKLNFDSELYLQNIIDSKYSKLRDALNNAKLITEELRLTDCDIQDFDDAIPIYLSQYAAYFAVIEIKQSSQSTYSVNLLKLNN